MITKMSQKKRKKKLPNRVVLGNRYDDVNGCELEGKYVERAIHLNPGGGGNQNTQIKGDPIIFPSRRPSLWFGC